MAAHVLHLSTDGDIRPLKSIVRLSLVTVDNIQLRFSVNDEIAAFGTIAEPLFYQVGNDWGGGPLTVAHKEEHMDYYCDLPELLTF